MNSVTLRRTLRRSRLSRPSTEPIFFPGNQLGIVLNLPEQFLSKQTSPYSRNLEYIDGVLEGRGGLQQHDTTALPGRIQLIEQFWKYDGSNYLMVLTQKDITYYDFTNTRFVYLNPLYTTGTIYINTGVDPLAVIGSGTAWSTELGAGDYIKIGTGSVNSDSTWYEVASVTDNNNLTLSSAGPHVSASQYTARKIFSGTTSNFWSVTTFVDDNLGEVFIMTNGVDMPHRWGGSGQAVPLATVATGFTAARYVGQFKDRIIFGWNVEGGTNSPQRVRASAVANCESWDDSLFWDFTEGQAWITGFAEFADYFVVMRERGARIGRFVGGTTIFEWEVTTVPTGCNAGGSIIVTDDTIFYYGIDNKFHAYNLLREETISDEILNYTKDFDPNIEQLIFGWQVEWKNQIRWFCPHSSASYNNVCLVYDCVQKMWQIWEYGLTQALCCMGEYINTTDIYCDDAVWGEYYADEVEDYCDDRTFLDAAPVLVYGGYDGYIRKADVTTLDESTEYTRTFDSKRLDFRLPDEDKRLWKQQFWFNSELSGTVTLQLKKGDNSSFEVTTGLISLISATKDKIKSDVTWDKTDTVFQVRVSSNDHFSMYGFFNYFMKKGKVIG